MKSLTMILISLIILGCATKEEGSSSSTQSEDVGGGLDYGGNLSFNLKGAQSALVTTESGISTGRSVSTRNGEEINEIYFSDGSEEGERQLKKQIINKRTSRSALSEENSTNFFIVDSDGNLKEGLSANIDLKILYTLMSPDNNFLYVALDPGYDEWGGLNWSGKFEESRRFIARNKCALLKVTISNGDFGCVDELVSPSPVSQDFKKLLSDSGIKPLQFDNDGNLYFIGHSFSQQNNCKNPDEIQWCDIDWDWNSPKILKKYNPSTSEIIDLTPDNDKIAMFKVIVDGSLVYTSTQTNQLKLITYDNSGNASTNSLNNTDSGWWGDLFFTTDDSGTVIFGAGQSGLNFARKHPVVVGARIVRTLNTTLFSKSGNQSTVRRVIKGDDGYIYGLFHENQGYWDSTKNEWINENALNLYSVLPYSDAAKATMKIGNDWWNALKRTDFQISKGYVYFTEKESHPTGLFQDRTVIKIRRLSDGKTTTLFNQGSEIDGYLVWRDRYEIYNWRLSDNILTFSGFDTKDSKVVMGEIDTKKVRQGKEASEYLVIDNVASALGANAIISDIEILTPIAPKYDTGSNPSIVKTFTNPSNLYSASIEFSKYMDNEGISNSVKMTETDNSSNIVSLMSVWIYKTLHLILDIDTTNADTDSLNKETSYTISIPKEVHDRYDWELVNNYQHSFTTIPLDGWYADDSEIIDNITDGYVATYVVDDSNLNNKYFVLLDNITDGDNDNTTDLDIEFSLKRTSSDWNQINFILKDNYFIDESKLDWSQSYYQDSVGNKWAYKNGLQGKKGGKYGYFFERKWENNQDNLVGYNNGTEEKWIRTQEHRTDGTYSYKQEHDSFGEKIIRYDNSSMDNVTAQFRSVEGYYQKCSSKKWEEIENKWGCVNPSTKYRHHTGEWRNIDNFSDILDWNDGEYVNISKKYYVMTDNGTTTDTLALDANGKEIRNYWEFEKVASFYTLEGGNGEQVNFSLWSSNQTYDTDLKSISGYFQINVNGSFLDSNGSIVSSPLESKEGDWKNDWQRFIPQSEKDRVKTINASRDEREYVFYLELNPDRLKFRRRTKENWEGFRWEDSFNDVYYYSSRRQVTGQWLKYKITMRSGQINVKFSDDSGNTLDLIDDTRISTETNSSSRVFSLILEPKSASNFSIDNLFVKTYKNEVALDNHSNLNEEFSSIPEFLENSQSY